MPKRIISLLLALLLTLSGCTSKNPERSENEQGNTQSQIDEIVEISDDWDDGIPSFTGLDDRNLQQFVEDQVYANLVDIFDDENYIIENVQAVYVSKEYIEELAYNSKANIYFGFTEAELYEQFQGEKYIFTLGEDGTTIVKLAEAYDDTYSKVIKNVAVGTGVILVCVTVSVATAGAGMPAVSLVFAASAKTAAEFAISGAVISSVTSGAITAYQTGGDMEATIKSAALAGSNSFKWGAISGAVIGGVSELSAIKKTADTLGEATEVAKNGAEISPSNPEWRNAELRALNEQGGYDQLTFLNGKQVEFGTAGGTRPDVVRNMIDHLEAVEVKYYDLSNKSCRTTLYKELRREIAARVQNLPAGSTQRIVLDVTGRGFKSDDVYKVAKYITDVVLKDIYPNIPIDIVGL